VHEGDIGHFAGFETLFEGVIELGGGNGNVFKELMPMGILPRLHGELRGKEGRLFAITNNFRARGRHERHGHARTIYVNTHLSIRKEVENSARDNTRSVKYGFGLLLPFAERHFSGVTVVLGPMKHVQTRQRLVAVRWFCRDRGGLQRRSSADEHYRNDLWRTEAFQQFLEFVPT